MFKVSNKDNRIMSIDVTSVSLLLTVNTHLPQFSAYYSNGFIENLEPAFDSNDLMKVSFLGFNSKLIIINTKATSLTRFWCPHCLS